MSERVSIRKMIDDTIKKNSDLNAFVLDYFPSVYKRFSDSMNRQIKINILLEQENPEAVLTALKEAGFLRDHRAQSTSQSGENISIHRSNIEQSPIETIRAINQSLGAYSAIRSIQHIYIISILVSISLSCINALSAWASSFHTLHVPTVSYTFFPIGLAHLCLYTISHSFYQTYFLIWDMTAADRVWSAILWSLHILALAACLLFPAYWGLIICVLVWAIHAKNRISLSTQPDGSPAKAILEAWIARSGIHARVSLLVGLLLATLANPLSYRYALGISLQDNEAAGKMLKFYTLLFNFMALVPLALIAYNKIRIVAEDDFRTNRIAEYNKKMEIFLRKNSRTIN